MFIKYINVADKIISFGVTDAFQYEVCACRKEDYLKSLIVKNTKVYCLVDKKSKVQAEDRR